MKSHSWIPLVDYSTKHQISISTLRRKIRGRAIPYKIDQGKYFLPDEPVEVSSRGRGRGFLDEEIAPPRSPETIMPHAPRSNVAPVAQAAPVADAPRSAPARTDDSRDQSVTFVAATKILEELKKAYAAILQEKEEQICQLKEEVSDLRTLARVLESENERLRRDLSSR